MEPEQSPRARAYLSLGSNQGDRFWFLREAETRLAATPSIRIVARSSIYESEPAGVVDQPWFLNQVLLIETTLDPHALLDVLLNVEASLGRTRTVRWGPRTVDIDLLLYDGQTIATDRLTVPHPELSRRRFILEPLAEIDPDLRLPDGRRVRDLLSLRGEGQAVRLVRSPSPPP